MLSSTSLTALAALISTFVSQGLCKPPPTVPAEGRGSAELNRVVSNSPRLDLFLNLPRNCDNAYNNLIQLLEDCKSGKDNGHPSLEYGCLLHIDFASPEFQCNNGENTRRRPENSAILFPAVTETPWHPTPKCEGPDCVEEEAPIWSGDNRPSSQDLPFDGGVGGGPGGPFGPAASREEIIQYLVQLLKERREQQQQSSSS